MKPSWDAYMLEVAESVALRATCKRKKVGAVLTRNNHILSTGYNGSLPGMPECEDVGCLMVNNHCERTVHAEANALFYAARVGNALEGSTIYTTASCCFNCFKALVQAGVKRFVYKEFYGSGLFEEEMNAICLKLDLEVLQIGY